jgi:hypothetical protein
MKKLIILVLYFVCLAVNVSVAQTSIVEERIANMFDDNRKLQWINYYKGRIDDVHDIAMSIGGHADTIRGSLIYLRSKEEFELKGVLKNDTIFLQELDIQDSITGFLTLVMKDRQGKGVWSNHDGSIGGLSISLHQVQEEPVLPSYCGDNKWIHYYRGIVENDDVELLIQRSAFNQVRGVGYFKKIGKNCTIKGEWSETDNIMLLDFKDEQNNKIGSLKGKFRLPEEVVATFTFPNGTKAYSTFTRDDDLKIGCMENANYAMSYDATYPKTKDQFFNAWMEKIIYNWLDSNTKIIDEAQKSELKGTPALRNFARFFAWVDLEFYSDELISGYQTFGSSWAEISTERVFNFDFETEKELSLKDIFIDNADFQPIIRNYILLEVQNNKYFKNEAYKSWILNQAFENFTVRRDGLTFSTQPNVTFGKQTVTIPFTILKPMLRPQGVVWKLANAQ